MKDSIDYIEKIIKEVRRSLSERPKQSISHRIDHFERVWKRAESIAIAIMEEQNIVIDMKALKIACYTHDLNEPFDGEKGDHVAYSLTDARTLLRQADCPENVIRKVLQINSEHSSENIKTPSSFEARILYDADKLDGLGAIGIARVFALCGQQGLSINETVKWYRAKIKKALPHMQTGIGTKLAAQELKYVESFLEKIEKETANL